MGGFFYPGFFKWVRPKKTHRVFLGRTQWPKPCIGLIDITRIGYVYRWRVCEAVDKLYEYCCSWKDISDFHINHYVDLCIPECAVGRDLTAMMKICVGIIMCVDKAWTSIVVLNM